MSPVTLHLAGLDEKEDASQQKPHGLGSKLFAYQCEALDVSVQAQVLNLLNDLQRSRGLTYIFISHDLSVVKFMSDMMAVMNDGKIVEFGPSENIYNDPHEDYTQRMEPADIIESLRKLSGQS